MPVTKVGDHYEVSGQEYDTEEKAEVAYKAMLALKFDLKEDNPPKKKSKKKGKNGKPKSTDTV